MFGFAALKSSTIFLKKLPSGPVNAFQTVSVAFPDGGWKAPVPPLLPAPALAPPLAAGLEDSPEPELLPAPADSDGADDAPVEVPLEAPPPAGEAALPPELLPPLHAATSTVVAAMTSSRRGQGASDMFRSPRKRPRVCGAAGRVAERPCGPCVLAGSPHYGGLSPALRPPPRCNLPATRGRAALGRPDTTRTHAQPRRRANRRVTGGMAYMAARPMAARLAALALFLALVPAAALPAAVAAGGGVGTGTYQNPLRPVIPGDGIVESCADPSVIHGQEGEGQWYMYCTSDPLNDEDRTASGFNFNLVPQLRSTDLVHWTYAGNAFPARPSFAAPTAGLWAPEIEYDAATGRYLLYVTVTDTLPDPRPDDSAIAVATSDGPLGPWMWSPTPVVEPHAADCCPGSTRNVFDPEVIQTDQGAFIYYGSYFGGISVRRLSADLMHSAPATQTNVAIANKYEGAEVVHRGGFYYLFVSATDCCRGPLTGYTVFAGRSKNPLGPFIDREGTSLLAGRVGGTPVISMNGNRWVGPGHNTITTDLAGQDWFFDHAVDRND